MGDTSGKVDFPLLCSNHDGAVTAVATMIVWMRGADQLLGVEFKGWKGALNLGLGAKTDAPCVRRTVVEQDVGSSAKTSADHARDTVVIECTADIQLVDQRAYGTVIVVYVGGYTKKQGKRTEAKLFKMEYK